MNNKKRMTRLLAIAIIGMMSVLPITGCTDPSGMEDSASNTEISDQKLSNGKEDTGKLDQNDESLLPVTPIIRAEGMTLETRFATPDGYARIVASADSLTAFLRQYELKEHGSPVLLFDGDNKGNQHVHAAVFTMPLVEGDLQQCADSVMRVWAEYYWSTGQYDKIAFHFTNGFLCEYSKWMEGYRVVVDGNDVYWSQNASYDDSYETFTKYLRMVFTYAGTLSMDSYESETIPLSDMEVGDVFLKGGSPGHVVMVVDICENAAGEKAFLLGQGYMPAQEFHVIKNPAHDEDPWYYENEILFPLRTAEYSFFEETMVKRLNY